ncbi:sigma-54 dependent transcriptional regulator [Horticoccus luteus]|uniref:Sigma-54 dependent transcriptional regulator n=1 Tax=Horticoccus luteus TaxID=2862869 RepID=A0A8F9TXS7_9BACT|nr:sigma-54 dependent transcriptional regulator [Horticoccus luteus]
MKRILETAWRVAPTTASVLLLGENGTGKTILAEAIHQRSNRAKEPFVTVNCPCLKRELLESELFGHVRGSFTGAISDAMGKVAAAEGGTLFLDEVGDLPLDIQPKLLRLLQDRVYERVGESRSRQANVRIIAATNRNLAAEVKAGRFREDLYYRLNVISLELPPLRERPEDILDAANHLLRSIGDDLHREFRGFTPLAGEALQSYDWPGNLRELRNVVERAAILSDRDILDLADFEIPTSTHAATPQVGSYVSLAKIEEEHIRQVIERTTTLEHAARILGIDKSTLYRKRKRQHSPLSDFEFANETAACAG